MNPETPPSTWGLTSRGLQQAKSLVGLVKQPMTVVAGDEPKMLQSLQPLAKAAGAEVHADPALSETHSEGWFGDEEFLRVIRRFFETPASPPAPGWETADAAADRLVHRLLEIATDAPRVGERRCLLWWESSLGRAPQDGPAAIRTPLLRVAKHPDARCCPDPVEERPTDAPHDVRLHAGLLTAIRPVRQSSCWRSLDPVEREATPNYAPFCCCLDDSGT